MLINAYFHIDADALGQVEVNDEILKEDGLNLDDINQDELFQWLINHDEYYKEARKNADYNGIYTVFDLGVLEMVKEG